MDDQPQALQALAAYAAAAEVIAPLTAGAERLGLVRGALQRGVLALAQAPHTPVELAAKLKLELERTVNLCRALDAHGVLVRTGEYYILAQSWAVLLGPEALTPLQEVLESVVARQLLLEQAAVGTATYWTLGTQERRTVASSVSVDPAWPHAPALMASVFENSTPDLHSLLANGGRYVELGCGLAGGLLCLLQAYPSVTAVGVDLASDLLEEAQRRAQHLGVANRVEFRATDAQQFTAEAPFDLVFWSQFFFPEASRVATLQTAWHSLRPGGYIGAPIRGEPALLDDLQSEQGRWYATDRLVYAGWGVPARGAEDLRQELEGAGFVGGRLVVTPISRILIARRPE